MVGLDYNVQNQDICDWFTHTAGAAHAKHFSVDVQRSYGQRGTARVTLPPSLLSVLHSLPGRLPGTKIYRVSTNANKFRWCRRCWSHKPNGDGDCEECEVKCPRCRGAHPLDECQVERGSCLHCESINCSVEECASHIVSHCRKLRDSLTEIKLPVPSDRMLAEAPALFNALPRRLRGRIAASRRPVHAGLSYLDAAKPAPPPVAPLLGPQVAALPDPLLPSLVNLVDQLQRTITELTETVNALRSKLSDQENHIKRLELHLHNKPAAVPRSNMHMEDDSDDDSCIPLASIPNALSLPDLDMHLRDLSFVPLAAPSAVSAGVLPAAAMDLVRQATPASPQVGAKRDVGLTRGGSRRPTPDAKRPKTKR